MIHPKSCYKTKVTLRFGLSRPGVNYPGTPASRIDRRSRSGLAHPEQRRRDVDQMMQYKTVCTIEKPLTEFFGYKKKLCAHCLSKSGVSGLSNGYAYNYSQFSINVI